MTKAERDELLAQIKDLQGRLSNVRRTLTQAADEIDLHIDTAFGLAAKVRQLPEPPAPPDLPQMLRDLATAMTQAQVQLPPPTLCTQAPSGMRHVPNQPHPDRPPTPGDTTYCTHCERAITYSADGLWRARGIGAD
jgi:hypothetical protein